MNEQSQAPSVIICHCNVISSADIHKAVREVQSDPLRIVTPGVIFSCCGARPRCGGCMTKFVEHISQAQDSIENEGCG